jgi:hypothetical protein
MRMKKQSQDLIAKEAGTAPRVEVTSASTLEIPWSHYCTLNKESKVVDRGRFRNTPSGVERWFTDLPSVHIAMEAGTHSIWISQQLQEMGHEVIVRTCASCERSPTATARRLTRLPKRPHPKRQSARLPRRPPSPCQ